MATQDTINTAVAALLASVTPAAGSAQANLIAQRDSLAAQLNAVNAQIQAGWTADQLQALNTLRQIRQMANRTGTQIPGLNAPAVAPATSTSTTTTMP